MSSGALAGGSVAVLALGMGTAFLGILLPPVFLPGTWIILLGLLGCAAAGVLAIARPPATDET